MVSRPPAHVDVYRDMSVNDACVHQNETEMCYSSTAGDMRTVRQGCRYKKNKEQILKFPLTPMGVLSPGTNMHSQEQELSPLGGQGLLSYKDPNLQDLSHFWWM